MVSWESFLFHIERHILSKFLKSFILILNADFDQFLGWFAVKFTISLFFVQFRSIFNRFWVNLFLEKVSTSIYHDQFTKYFDFLRARWVNFKCQSIKKSFSCALDDGLILKAMHSVLELQHSFHKTCIEIAVRLRYILLNKIEFYWIRKCDKSQCGQASSYLWRPRPIVVCIPFQKRMILEYLGWPVNFYKLWNFMLLQNAPRKPKKYSFSHYPWILK